MKEPAKLGFIYLFTNLVNSKKYVGQTREKSVEIRWKNHLKEAAQGSCTYPIHRAIKRYGWHNFSKRVLWIGDVALLNSKETYYIKRHKSFIDHPLKLGYNLTMGGGSNVVSKRTSRLLSKSIKAAHEADPTYRERAAAGNKIAWSDPDFKAMMVDIRLATWQDSKTQAKYTAARRKTVADPVHSVKLTNIVRAYWAEDTNRQAQSERLKRTHTNNPALCSRHSEVTTASWLRDDYRTTLSEARRIMWQSPEYRKKRLATLAKNRERRSASAQTAQAQQV